MSLSVKIIIIFCLAAVLGVILIKPALFVCKKLKAEQTILHYVEKHSVKKGTPTMGGVIFIFAAILACGVFLWQHSLYAWLAILVMVAFGLLGFLDDFIKIHFHQNQGLKPYQKIIGQAAIALIIAFSSTINSVATCNFLGLT